MKILVHLGFQKRDPQACGTVFSDLEQQDALKLFVEKK